MNCLMCKDLERIFKSRRRQYFEARSAKYYQISTELAAYKNVEMERAKADLEEHRLVCVSCAEGLKSGPTTRFPHASCFAHV